MSREVLPPDPARESLAAELQSLSLDEFRARIAEIGDDDRLGYLRYDLGWAPDPRESSWQAKEINRLLTRRREAGKQDLGASSATMPSWRSPSEREELL